MEFSELPIPEAVLAGIREAGYVTCTPIQSLTLPLTLNGRDVAGQAQTGTGKTAAFLIAALSRLSGKPNRSHPKASDSGESLHDAAHPTPHHPDRSPCSHPRCLIIAPTRELVVQIERDARLLAALTEYKIAAVYGGVDYDKQKQLLLGGHIDILIGTPGRLIDFYKQKAYRVDSVESLVIDEADRMFDMGFIADLRYLLRRLPSYENRLSMLFSATLSYRSQELSYEFMNSPAILATESDVRTVVQVEQALYHVEGRRKVSLLVGLLHRDLKDRPDGVSGRIMIFVNTKRAGEFLRKWLRANGIHAGYLSGDVPQSVRLRVLQRFGDGLLPVLIATDVAGRGLHIEGVTHVVNFDLPENPEDYVHRIGRTARAGAKGDAISLVDEDGVYHLEAIENFIGVKVATQPDDPELYASLVRPSSEEGASKHSTMEMTGRNRRGRNPRRKSANCGMGASQASVDQVTTPIIAAAEGEQHGPSQAGGAVTPRKRRRRRKRTVGAGVTEPPAVAEITPPAGD
ncbi:MAG: DEAD/DEAH box helicase [Magnetococcales bacterium]|nr:DEAD/DEAH box helicase [Magnetococcales bacterium]